MSTDIIARGCTLWRSIISKASLFLLISLFFKRGKTFLISQKLISNYSQFTIHFYDQKIGMTHSSIANERGKRTVKRDNYRFYDGGFVYKLVACTDHIMVIPTTELKDERIGFRHFCYLYLRKIWKLCIFHLWGNSRQWHWLHKNIIWIDSFPSKFFMIRKFWSILKMIITITDIVKNLAKFK